MMRVEFKDKKELSKYLTERTEHTYICECSNRVTIPPKHDSLICDWCGRRVYSRNGEKKKFKEEILKRMER